MCYRLLVSGLMIFVLIRSAAAGPAEFHVVSVFCSDNGLRFYYRILDVTPEGSDSMIRYVRIAPADDYCPRLMVQAAEARVRGKSPAQLAGSNNLCAVQPAALQTTLKHCRTGDNGLETISFGIVAQCGRSSVSLALPDLQSASLKKMQASNPAAAGLWYLSSAITHAAFGADDIFHDRDEQDDLHLQLAGQKLVPQLTSGRYDTALAAAVLGNIGSWTKPSFRSLLAGYRGPISAVESAARYAPRLLSASSYRFAGFAAPQYPLLAMQARIQGEVQLRLTVEAWTGEVREASAISGNPLLARSAIEAARQWRFEPEFLRSPTVDATIEFSLRCEP